MENKFDLTTLLVFLFSFLAAFASVMVFSLTLPGAPFGPDASLALGNETVSPPPQSPEEPPAQKEVNISAERTEWRTEDLDRTQQYWSNASPISIGGMVRTGDLLSVVFINKLPSNVTLDTLNISGNSGRLSLEIEAGKFSTRSFQSQEPCEPGDFRVYQISYNYTSENATGEFSGALPYIVKCG
jgi:hypothetical protein